MIWATVSSWSCFCWLYRVSPSSAAKTVIYLISVLTIWWCPCVESSLVLLEEGVCYGIYQYWLKETEILSRHLQVKGHVVWNPEAPAAQLMGVSLCLWALGGSTLSLSYPISTPFSQQHKSLNCGITILIISSVLFTLQKWEVTYSLARMPLPLIFPFAPKRSLENMLIA